MIRFSVCMSIYQKDSPEFLIEALDSIIKQTLVPNEIVLVEDGPIPSDLEEIVCKYEREYDFIKVIRVPQNGGLGKALQIALENSTYNVIARMDSDDISLPNRFEKQIRFLMANPNVDIVGGDSAKFQTSIQEIIGYRHPKLTDSDIKQQLKNRSPFSHVTIMAKKEAIIKAGGYVEIFNQEDYYLWARMANEGCKFANIKDVLVYVRVLGLGSRRGGWKYFRNELFMQQYLLKSQIIGLPKYIYNILIKFIVQVLLTPTMRQWAYSFYLKVNS